MFLRLWSEISLFHKLIYDIAPGSILIGWDIAIHLWRHRQRPRRWRVFCRQTAMKLNKSVFFLRFCEFNMWIKRIWNEFSFHTVFMKLVCFISPRQRLGDIKTHNSFHKYRMKWKFISDPIFLSTYDTHRYVYTDRFSTRNVFFFFFFFFFWGGGLTNLQWLLFPRSNRRGGM